MAEIERHLERYLVLLRKKIREKGFTQMEMQEALGWGKSYISQLLTRQKRLQFDQVFSILRVIGVDPREFFAELNGLPPQPPAFRRQPPGVGALVSNRELEDLSSLLLGLVKLLIEKQVITAAELSATIQAAEEESRLLN